MRSTAICVPTRAVLPPAAAVPDSGWSVPILYGLVWPNALRQGAGTSIEAPRAPAVAAPKPSKRRRVTLPLYQKSSAAAHFSCIQRSSIVRSSFDSIGVDPAGSTRARRSTSASDGHWLNAISADDRMDITPRQRSSFPRWIRPSCPLGALNCLKTTAGERPVEASWGQRIGHPYTPLPPDLQHPARLDSNPRRNRDFHREPGPRGVPWCFLVR